VQSETATPTTKKTRSENIDLFAAGDRTLLDLSSTSSTSMSSNTLSTSGGFGARAAADMSQQAGLLKLEAQREALAMDQQRIADQKVSIVAWFGMF
jgi:hypothetical protein